MTTKLVLGKDSNGNVTFVIPFPDNGTAPILGQRTMLAPSVAQSVTVPLNVNVAIFSYGSGTDIWVDPVNAATLPGVAFATTTAELNPVGRFVTPGTTLSVISEAAAEVKISFYQMAANFTGVS